MYTYLLCIRIYIHNEKFLAPSYDLGDHRLFVCCTHSRNAYCDHCRDHANRHSSHRIGAADDGVTVVSRTIASQCRRRVRTVRARLHDYLADRKQIWVFIRPTLANTTTNLPVNFGQWLAYADTFKDGEPETDPTFAAPTRLLQPKRGFGKVWRENVPVRVGIGWALDWEQAYNASLTTYPIGTIEGGKFNHKFSFHIITTMDGSSIHVNEATYLWSKQ